MSSEPPIPHPGGTALFLDVDGTLLDIKEHPGDVVADDGLLDLLHNVHDVLDGALCLVTGRATADVDRIFGGGLFPVAGGHGTELRMGDGAQLAGPDASLPDEVVEALEDFVARHDGLLLEHKHGGASLHYRKAPELENECRALVDGIMAEIGMGFRLIAGKMVFEIAPSSHDKGLAVETFLEHAPFAGRMPVFVGDDVTDEDGFRAVNRLNGLSIVVGERDDSEAGFSLPDVEAVRTWLEQLLKQT